MASISSMRTWFTSATAARVPGHALRRTRPPPSYAFERTAPHLDMDLSANTELPAMSWVNWSRSTAERREITARTKRIGFWMNYSKNHRAPVRRLGDASCGESQGRASHSACGLLAVAHCNKRGRDSPPGDPEILDRANGLPCRIDDLRPAGH